MFTTSQTYFNKAVILLFGHGVEGSAGVIVNKQTQHVMGEFRDASTLPESYDACPLYLGGDVGPEVLHLVHVVEGVEKTTCIVPGVYMGGVEGVGEALAEGRASRDDVKLLTRYAGWGPGQLEEEVRRGVWIVAAASREVIMGRGGRGGGVFQGDAAWHAVLQMMGGEYAGLSEAVQGEDIFASGEDGWVETGMEGMDGMEDVEDDREGSVVEERDEDKDNSRENDEDNNQDNNQDNDRDKDDDRGTGSASEGDYSI